MDDESASLREEARDAVTTTKQQDDYEGFEYFMSSLTSVEGEADSSQSFKRQSPSTTTSSSTSNSTSNTSSPTSSQMPIYKLQNEFFSVEQSQMEKEICQRAGLTLEAVRNEEQERGGVVDLSPESGQNMVQFMLAVKRSWGRVLAEVRINDDFASTLLSMHKRGDESNSTFLTKALFKNHMETLERILRNFALAQDVFVQLPLADQEALLSKNTGLFQQYFFGKYLFAGSGYQQQQWLLLCQVPDCLTEKSYLRFIPFATFNAIVNIFNDRTSMEKFENMARQLNGISIQYRCNCAMAFAILFDAYGENIDTLLSPESLETARMWQSKLLGLAGWEKNKFNCGTPEDLQMCLVSRHGVQSSCTESCNSIGFGAKYGHRIRKVGEMEFSTEN